MDRQADESPAGPVTSIETPREPTCRRPRAGKVIYPRKYPVSQYHDSLIFPLNKPRALQFDITLPKMTLPTPRLYHPISDHNLLPQLAQIHAACIKHDNQLATFLPPLSHLRMLDYWREVSSDVEKGRTVIILQFTDAEEGEVAGYVCLMMPVTETGPFRGEVNKLMVSPRHRRKGVARRVIELLEEVARERGRGLLVSCSKRVAVQVGSKLMV